MRLYDKRTHGRFPDIIGSKDLIPINEFSTQNDSDAIIPVLKDFIQGLDSFLGGFIFYTPNPLNDTIILKDKSEIPGVTKYRNIFNQIAIPILSIVIAGIAIGKIGSDNVYGLKSFAMRLSSQ